MLGTNVYAAFGLALVCSFTLLSKLTPVPLIHVCFPQLTHATLHWCDSFRALRIACIMAILSSMLLSFLTLERTLGQLLAIHALYLATITASVVLYRISPIHPLSGYPGPLVYKTTKLAGVCAALSGKQHILLKRMHEEYGPIVRIGEQGFFIVP